jgi:hypothetical protein
MEIMKYVGCRPPYWEVQATIPNCTSSEQLKTLGMFFIQFRHKGILQFTTYSQKHEDAFVDIL